MTRSTNEAASAWRVGEVVDGRYRVTRVHEQGGMGVVYRVRHLAWDIELAVKCPRPEQVHGEDGQRKFVAEAETWVSLGMHPHVCNCFYVRVLDGVPRVFAEYVPCGSLHEWITDRRLYDGDPPEVLARILDVAIQTAWGLEHAHGRGLVHRDVKPANVLLDTGDGAVTAKITDFGLARARDLAATVTPDTPPGASILVPGGGGLTPRYASPEQSAGDPVGRRTDIYSFAVSVLEMCVGEATWMAGPVAGAALAAYRDGAVVIPPALRDLLERCLRHDPADRPASMADVAGELIDIYQDVTGHTYPRPAPVVADLLTDELNNRAVSLLDLDRHAEAEEAFAQALAADPQNARAIYNAGLVRWRRGAVTDDALIAEIEATRADTGDPWQVRFVLAQLHLERGDLGTARTLLDDLARERPDEPEISESLNKILSGELVDARCVHEWEVPWPPRPPAEDLWVQATTTVPDLTPFALTPDGRLQAVGGWDGTIRLYDVHSGQCVRTVKAHRRPVLAVDLTPDGRFAVSVCEDEVVRFWDLNKRRFTGSTSGRRLYASPNPPDRSSPRDDYVPRSADVAIRLTDDGRRALYTDRSGVFHVWDVHTGREIVRDESRADRLVEVSADGRRALSVRSLRLGHDREDAVRLWDLTSGRCVRELLPGHKPAVDALCFSAHGRLAATAGGGTIRVWDLDDGRCLHAIAARATTLSLSADARWLLSGSRYGSAVRWWQLDSGRCLRTYQAHRGGTMVVRLDAGGRFALTAGQDRTVRRWALPGDHRGAPLLSRPRPHVELSRLGGRVDALVTEAEQEMTAGRFPAALDLLRQARAIDGYERAPRVMSAWWALGRRAMRTEPRAAWSSRVLRVGEQSAVDLSADGRIVVTGRRDGAIQVWDVESGDCVRVLEGHQRVVQSVCVSADGRRLLSGSQDGEVRLWEVDTGTCQQVLPIDQDLNIGYLQGNGDSLSARFDAYDRQAVISGLGRPTRLWDPHAAGPPREVPIRHGLRSKGICLADDGRLAAAVSHNDVTLWDLELGKVVHRLNSGSLFTMDTAALSADGRLALTADFKGFRLWDTATGDVIRTFGGEPPSGFHTIRMTADGRFALFGSYRSYLTIWDVHSGRCIRVLDGHEQGALQVVLAPDGRFVLAKHEGYLRVWELDWELAAREAADWDAGAAPYLEAFLHRFGPQWTGEDLDALTRRLQDVGYGWLRAGGVRAQLDRVTRGTWT
jgi:WD40 repeat protein/serine/threonine protein kinase